MNTLNKLIESLYLKIPGNRVYYDEMTGLKTRCYYDQVAKSKYADDEIFIAYLDINSLKKVNDEQSHHAGSELIKEVANKIKMLDVLDACRIGGDEFLIFANKDFDRRDLDILKEVSYGYVIKGITESVSEAVHKADAYMYRRKSKIHKRGESHRRKKGK